MANGNGTFDIAPGLIGYEWDVVPEDQYRPAGLIKLSETTLNWSGILVDQGNRVQPGTATHNLTLYRDDSGALVFGSGTVFWSWGLSNEHDSSPYGANIANPRCSSLRLTCLRTWVSSRVRCNPGLTLAGSASTDTTAATVTLTDLPAQIAALQPVTITGTATDNDGNPATTDGVVALVEVSLDGGATWRVAHGGTSWSYQWLPT